MSHKYFDYKNHPFYVLALGFFFGVSVTSGFIKFFISENYMKKEEISAHYLHRDKLDLLYIKKENLDQYLAKLGEKRIPIKEYQQNEELLIQCEQLKNCPEPGTGAHVAEPPVNVEKTSVELSMTLPMSKYDDNLSLILLRVEPDKVRVQVNTKSLPRKEKRYHLYFHRNLKITANGSSYLIKLLDISKNKTVLIGISKY